MDNSETRNWLDAEWNKVLAAADAEPDPDIDRLVNSEVQSIRYALATQVLGKIADPNRSLLYCQSGSGEPGAWDARSFCSAVIVPWAADNQDVIGKSPDPYVSNPLRRARLSRHMPRVKNGAEWEALVTLLESLDGKSADDLRSAYRRCLAGIARRLTKQTFRYPIPKRVSAAKTRTLLEEFLAEPSNGLRPMAVAAGLMQVLGEGFNLFRRVESQGVNEADAVSGVPGDLMCYADDGSVVVAVEVKDRNLTLADVRSSVRKAELADMGLSNLLFTAPGMHLADKAQIDESKEQAWASGLNLYQIDLLDLAASSFVLLDESWRPKLLRGIGVDLDRRGDHRHRRAWHDLLCGISVED